MAADVKLDLEQNQTERIAEYHKPRQQIQRRFDEATDEPQHFEKVQWFARYWNLVLEEHSITALDASQVLVWDFLRPIGVDAARSGG
jgi:hypothetical protein